MLVEPVVNSFFIYKTMKQCEMVQTVFKLDLNRTGWVL